MVTFTQKDIENSVIESKIDNDNEYYLIRSMSEWLTYSDPQYLKANDIKAKNSSNSYYFTEYAQESNSWVFDKDKTRTTYMQRIDSWTPYNDVLEAIEKEKSQFLSDPKIKEAFKRLVMYKRNKKFTIDDGELIFERVMSGDPEYYQSNVRKSIKKGIRILLNFSQNCGQSAATFAKNTIEMFKIAYIFELMGIPVQILAGFVPLKATHNKRFAATLFVLKSENENINLQKSALIACPGILRYHGFAAGAVHYTGSITSGYGSTQPVSEEFKKFVNCDFLIGQENRADKVIEELLKLV